MFHLLETEKMGSVGNMQLLSGLENWQAVLRLYWGVWLVLS